MRRLRRGISPGAAVERALTGRARPFGSGGPAENLRRLEAAVGRQEAARRLGVSERTLRRYRAGGTPTRANAARLAEVTRTSPEVRRAAISDARRNRLRNRGSYVRMTADIGVTGDPKYKRRRTIGTSSPVHLSGEQMAAIQDAFDAGDTDGAVDALRDALGEEYAAGITFDDVQALEFLRDDPSQ
jgi:hypothetical protein